MAIKLPAPAQPQNAAKERSTGRFVPSSALTPEFHAR
jgi:hypothetical protein